MSNSDVIRADSWASSRIFRATGVFWLSWRICWTCCSIELNNASLSALAAGPVVAGLLLVDGLPLADGPAEGEPPAGEAGLGLEAGVAVALEAQPASRTLTRANAARRRWGSNMTGLSQVSPKAPVKQSSGGQAGIRLARDGTSRQA